MNINPIRVSDSAGSRSPCPNAHMADVGFGPGWRLAVDAVGVPQVARTDCGTSQVDNRILATTVTMW